MKCNVGGFDQKTRLIAGVVLLVAAIVVPMSIIWQTVMFVLAAIALITGIVRYCPVNKLLGISTCEKEHKLSSGST